MPRDSPVVEVSQEQLDEFSDLQIGSRVLAALAHTPAERAVGSYHAICVASDATAVSMTADDVLDASYDTLLNWAVGASDERRVTVGRKVRRGLRDADQFIVARS